MGEDELFEKLAEWFGKGLEWAVKVAENLPGIDPIGLVVGAIAEGIFIGLKNLGHSEEEARANFHKHTSEARKRHEERGPLTGLR